MVNTCGDEIQVLIESKLEVKFKELQPTRETRLKKYS